MLTLNVYIYKPLLAAIAGAKDHKALACPMSGNRQSCENFEIFYFVRNTFGSHCLAKIFKFEKLKRFFTDDAWKVVGKLG